MGVFAASGQARTFDFFENDVGFVSFAMGHYIENTGTTMLRFLEVFKSDYYADVSLDQWLALTPPELVTAHLHNDPQFIAKLRVYSISDQDDAGVWLRSQFPGLFYIVSPSPKGSSDYAHATWTGISGDRWYMNGPLYMFSLVDNPWLTTNVMQNHGPLGALYPPLKYIMEGDTPSWLGLIDNGLGWALSPTYGGWGGRYAFSKPAGETHAVWTNDNMGTRDTVTYAPGQTATSDQATIWRWRDHYQYDFAARMNWCVADTFAKANHNPIPALNGDLTKSVLTIAAKGGSTVTLAADGTTDPDGDTVTLTWWIYPEAGTVTAPATLSAAHGTTTQLRVPQVSTPGTLHVILQAEDNGTPHLFAYRRAILQVTP